MKSTRITEKVERLMTKASRETVEGFAEAYGKLEAEMNRVTGKLDAVEQERKEREFKGRQIKLFISTLGRLEAETAETVETMKTVKTVTESLNPDRMAAKRIKTGPKPSKRWKARKTRHPTG